ncbi:MAG: PadR family transcriptional regulator [Chloroflexi bacterium]|nr:PadR family transcriptional regulator [Chloroflexota bacterium]
MEQDQHIDNLVQELRRGVIVLAILSQLQEEQYGYSAMKQLADQGLNIDQGTLYPLLRRLESQDLLESKWRLEDSRPRRYYVISPHGRQVLHSLQQEWSQIVATMDTLLSEQERK